MLENSFPTQFDESNKNRKVETYLDRYKLKINDILVEINIVLFEDEPTPHYMVSLTNISDATKLVLEKIRQEFISRSENKQGDKAESQNENKDRKKRL